MASSHDEGLVLSGHNRTRPGDIIGEVKALAIGVMKQYDRLYGLPEHLYLRAAKDRVKEKLEEYCARYRLDDEEKGYLLANFDAGFGEAALKYQQDSANGDFHLHLHDKNHPNHVSNRNKPRMEVPPGSLELQERAAREAQEAAVGPEPAPPPPPTGYRAGWPWTR